MSSTLLQYWRKQLLDRNLGTMPSFRLEVRVEIYHIPEIYLQKQDSANDLISTNVDEIGQALDQSDHFDEICQRIQV